MIFLIVWYIQFQEKILNLLIWDEYKMQIWEVEAEERFIWLMNHQNDCWWISYPFPDCFSSASSAELISGWAQWVTGSSKHVNKHVFLG